MTLHVTYVVHIPYVIYEYLCSFFMFLPHQNLNFRHLDLELQGINVAASCCFPRDALSGSSMLLRKHLEPHFLLTLPSRDRSIAASRSSRCSMQGRTTTLRHYDYAKDAKEVRNSISRFPHALLMPTSSNQASGARPSDNSITQASPSVRRMGNLYFPSSRIFQGPFWKKISPCFTLGRSTADSKFEAARGRAGLRARHLPSVGGARNSKNKGPPLRRASTVTHPTVAPILMGIRKHLSTHWHSKACVTTFPKKISSHHAESKSGPFRMMIRPSEQTRHKLFAEPKSANCLKKSLPFARSAPRASRVTQMSL